MARTGKLPNDYRSEGERVRSRPSKSGMRGEDLARSLDSVLRERIYYSLAQQPEVSVSEIVVDVREGVVHLFGSVDTINTKYLVERLVKRVGENIQLENQLTIRVGEALEEFTRGADASRIRELHWRASRRF